MKLNDTHHVVPFGGNPNQVGIFAVEVVRKSDGRLSGFVSASAMQSDAAMVVMFSVVEFFRHCGASPEKVREAVESALTSCAAKRPR